MGDQQTQAKEQPWERLKFWSEVYDLLGGIVKSVTKRRGLIFVVGEIFPYGLVKISQESPNSLIFRIEFRHNPLFVYDYGMFSIHHRAMPWSIDDWFVTSYDMSGRIEIDAFLTAVDTQYLLRRGELRDAKVDMPNYDTGGNFSIYPWDFSLGCDVLFFDENGSAKDQAGRKKLLANHGKLIFPDIRVWPDGSAAMFTRDEFFACYCMQRPEYDRILSIGDLILVADEIARLSNRHELWCPAYSERYCEYIKYKTWCDAMSVAPISYGKILPIGYCGRFVRIDPDATSPNQIS